MKKIILSLLIAAALLSTAYAEAKIISEDFYISGRRTIDENVVSVTSILPNTLFVQLEVGQETEVRADILPEEAHGTRVLWSLPESTGNVQITPQNRTCRIFAVSPGDEAIRVDTPDGAHALVRVRVTEKVRRELVLDCDLPNIEVGESAKIHAQTIPESSETVSFRIEKGKRNADIDADGNTCVVRGKSSGDVTVKAVAGELEREITLSVTDKSTGIGGRIVVTVLAVSAFLLLFASAAFAVARRRGK